MSVIFGVLSKIFKLSHLSFNAHLKFKSLSSKLKPDLQIAKESFLEISQEIDDTDKELNGELSLYVLTDDNVIKAADTMRDVIKHLKAKVTKNISNLDAEIQFLSSFEYASLKKSDNEIKAERALEKFIENGHLEIWSTVGILLQTSFFLLGVILLVIGIF